MHTHLAYAFLVVASLCGAAPSAVALTPFEAVYGIRILIVRGESVVSLRTDGAGNYVYDAHTRPKGFLGAFVRGEIRETSRFRLEGSRVVPLHYERVDTISADARDMELEFDWERGVVTRRHDDTEEQLELTPQMIDPGLLAIAVMHDLGAGNPPGPYTLVEREALEPVAPVLEGEEKLATRAGDFSTLRFAHHAPEKGRTTRLWAAAELGFLMVQMSQFSGEKTRATLTLKELEQAP